MTKDNERSIKQFSLVTVIYPIYDIVINSVFVAMVVWRRHQLSVASMSRCPLLVEFALATLKIALNGRNLTFLLPLITGICVSLWTRPLPLAFGHLI